MASFAEIVFDRPLDVLFSYAIPEDLRERVSMGVRVAAPFGKGNKLTDGFVVGITDNAPSRAVKTIEEVHDDLALVDDHLLKLTRWIADYYLCGWGQVLHAVVPAAVRDKAGTREVTF